MQNCYRRRRMSPYKRFISDVRYYFKRYAGTVLSAILEFVVSALFLATTIFGLPIIGCLFY